MAIATRLRLAILAFILGLAAILAAWGFQIFGGYVPCQLCLEQRIPYYAGLPILVAAIAVLRLGFPVQVGRALLALGGVLFLVGFGLGVYHAGVEWNLWLGPSDCGGGVATTTKAGDLLSQIGHTKVVSCGVAAWRLFGISLAGWNALVCLIVAGLSLKASQSRA